MVVSVILLGGIWGVEWLKSNFEHGVPTLAAASVATGELAMFLYFVGSLVRACKWAFSEFDDAVVAIRNTHLFRDVKRALGGFLPLLAEAMPSPRQWLRASRFVILFLGLGVVTLIVLGALSFLTSNQSTSNFNTPPLNRNSNSNKNRNINGPSENTNAAPPLVSHDEDRGLVSTVLSALVSVFDHSGAVAIIATVLVGLTILTFFTVQIVRAYAEG
jgi:hypothetical protein